MKTPEQIRDMEFQKSTMGGYKQSDVEMFLEEVASQIEILTKQKNDAERKLQEFTKKAPEAALSTAGIQSVLVNAQRVAEEVIEQANSAAEGVIADANAKLNEADVKAKEISAEAEDKAVLLGETAENEAAKIIAAALQEADTIVAEAKESVELQQKLYDRMQIEIVDFKKKAVAQCGALIELMNQLPGEVPFNIERSKVVLSTDFSDPAELLKIAVEARLEKESAAKAAETPVVSKAEEIAEDVPAAMEEIDEEEPETQEVVESIPEPEFDEQLSFEPLDEDDEEFEEDFDQEEIDEEFEDELFEEELIKEMEADAPFSPVITEETIKKSKGHISFGQDDDDDDDDDDEPRLFFRRKKK